MLARKWTARIAIPAVVTGAGLFLFPTMANAVVIDDFVSLVDAGTGDGWAIHPDQVGDADEAFVEGPATPPVGRGSLAMTTPADLDRAVIFAVPKPPSEPTSWSGTSGRYSTYTYESAAINVPILKFIGYQVFDTENPLQSTGFTTLNFPGAIQSGGVKANEWQTWTLGADSKVWQSNTGDGFCAQDDPCTFSAFADHYPDGAWGQIQLGLGNGAPEGLGFVDDVMVSDGDADFTYDFEAPAGSNSTASIVKGNATSTGGSVDVTLNASELAADTVTFNITKVDENGNPVDPPVEVDPGDSVTGNIPVPFGTTKVTVSAQDVVLDTLTVTFAEPATPTEPVDNASGESGGELVDTGGTGSLVWPAMALLVLGAGLVAATNRGRRFWLE